MSIRNILVACNDAEGAPNALLVGAAMAKHHHAHLTGLLANASYETYPESGWIPDEVRAIIARANSEALSKIEERFQSFAATLDLSERLHFKRAEGRADATTAQMARGFDIVLLDQLAGDVADHHLLLHPDRIALQSGRPVMVVPKTAPAETPFSHVVFAWDGRRAAARALADALDMLSPGATITILSVGDFPLPRPVDEIATHIERHGLKADPRHFPAPNGRAEAILDFCRDNTTDLVVMGAYEHSKFRTDIVGSLSSAIWRKSTVPVVLSH